jgi:vacuolar-type H+-ATPase subunit C/Vma6
VAEGYGYANARLRAMRSRLLARADYDDLLSRTHIEDVITRLAATPYKEDVEVALARFSGVRCIFEALSANLTHTLLKTREFFEGEPRVLVGILLRRWDRQNLLAILRGQSREIPPEIVLSAVVPVGQLDEVALREMARQPGLRAAIDLMTTWRLPYAQVLREVRARAGAAPDLDQLELALTRFHYNSLREPLSQGDDNHSAVLEFVQSEVDLLNLSTVLRLVWRPELVPLAQQRYRDAGVRSLLVEPGGFLSTARLAQLVTGATGLEGLVQALGNTRYGPALEAGWQRYQASEGGITVLERELERWRAAGVAAMFRRNPLSVAVPIGYLGCKEIEVANLRLVAQAVALDMAREQVRADLIII